MITEPARAAGSTRPGTAPFHELVDESGKARAAARAVVEHLDRMGHGELEARQMLADLEILTQGITFTVYAEACNIDRPWPFDVIPRVLDASEWRTVESGLSQRVRALNRFIDDVYNDQAVIKAGVLPASLI